MTLLERLRPYYEERLTKANLEYPNLVATISDALEEVEFITDLKYGTVMDLNLICGNVPSPFYYFTE